LIEGVQPKHVFAILVADITYIDTLEGFLFLALLTDLMSRKIVGFDLSDSLEMEGCLRTLDKASKNMPVLLRQQAHKMQKTGQAAVIERLIEGEKITLNMIHHSDRGVQYASNRYTQKLKELNFQISMADTGNCYQNAVAERVNGILKTEFELGQRFPSKKIAQLSVPQAIELYNNKRPHTALKFKTPQQVFNQNILAIAQGNQIV
jgi:transposase InsO family protein